MRVTTVTAAAFLWGCSLLFGLTGMAQAADSTVAGIWWSPRKDAKIELYFDSNGALTGRLIAMPTRTAQDVDVKNPESRLRTRRVLGLVIFTGFRQESKTRWVDGKVYDPESGGTFSSQISMEDNEHVIVRGYLGLPLFGRNETFTRVAGSDPRHRQAGEPELVHLDMAREH